MGLKHCINTEMHLAILNIHNKSQKKLLLFDVQKKTTVTKMQQKKYPLNLFTLSSKLYYKCLIFLYRYKP